MKTPENIFSNSPPLVLQCLPPPSFLTFITHLSTSLRLLTLASTLSLSIFLTCCLTRLSSVYLFPIIFPTLPLSLYFSVSYGLYSILIIAVYSIFSPSLPTNFSLTFSSSLPFPLHLSYSTSPSFPPSDPCNSSNSWTLLPLDTNKFFLYHYLSLSLLDVSPSLCIFPTLSVSLPLSPYPNLSSSPSLSVSPSLSLPIPLSPVPSKRIHKGFFL